MTLHHRLGVRRPLAAVAAIAAVFALAGCGGDDSGAAKASDTSTTSVSTDPSGSASAGSTEDSGSGSGATAAVGSQLSGPDFAAILKKALDQATTAKVSMDLGSTGSGEGEADYTKSPPEMSMKLSMSALGGDVEVRLVGGTMYMQSPSFGDKWVSIPLDDPNSPMGALGSQLDVTKLLQTFADAVTTATYTGPEDVDGESLDHYVATVDTQKMLSGMPGGATGPTGSLPTSMSQEWWFDGDGMIRQFSSEFSGQKTVMKLSDWGTDVDIEAPPSSEVTTMPGAGG